MIGAKYFGEQRVLCHLLATFVECSSNIKVVRRTDVGGTVMCLQALAAGEVDLYVEYTGTGMFLLTRTDEEQRRRSEELLGIVQSTAHSEIRALEARLAAEEAVLAELDQAERHRKFVSEYPKDLQPAEG